MKIAIFDEGRLGVVQDGLVHDVSAALATLPVPGQPWMATKGDPLIAALEVLRPAIEAALPSAVTKPVAQARFRSPVQRPSKIVGVPVNYHAHVAEAEGDVATFSDRFRGSIEQQGFFLKAVSALVGPGEGITLRFPDRRNDHEMELGVVIGRTISNIGVDEALGAIAGYAIALDMVVRGPEDRSLRKSGDSYAVLGPWLVTADEIADPERLDFSLHVNGELRQASNTRHMIMKLAEQIAYASRFYTLYPGDIIMTGTCEGVGPVVPGDVITCTIQDIADMTVAIHPHYTGSEETK
ncbi:fumarylacetoacetate hydrolase family protein [Sphingomonas turrisvirgatae]|uniref:2-hydroxyhepta-2,4-diene-1,7-dioate isomerase n=1 Tax=Sphingomonas turrisvirgatae TaxID=1888892 RepID=A0A1E3LTT3_9SPHN|nr:fumarylacetoacetate hydrolase family protein [Sphingomonas turrisvirgatae]ODP37168.1 2-hydroxyhepta-2,4-diene-1,7-dioate isomerase [Sphingomonas turrisvirgatae]